MAGTALGFDSIEPISEAHAIVRSTATRPGAWSAFKLFVKDPWVTNSLIIQHPDEDVARIVPMEGVPRGKPNELELMHVSLPPGTVMPGRRVVLEPEARMVAEDSLCWRLSPPLTVHDGTMIDLIAHRPMGQPERLIAALTLIELPID